MLTSGKETRAVKVVHPSTSKEKNENFAPALPFYSRGQSKHVRVRLKFYPLEQRETQQDAKFRTESNLGLKESNKVLRRL